MDQRSRELRKTIIEVLHAAGRGHVGPSLSLVEILRVLYDSVLRYDPARPDDPNRDRFILSKGHGCLAQYVLLKDKGFVSKDALFGFCRYDGCLGGHPTGDIPGVEMATGSLGHGLALAVGMALAARINRAAHRVFVLLGDGECGEGTIWEAAMGAAKHGLDNLTALVDYNKLQSYGDTEAVSGLEPFAAKWASFGFAVRETDGHDVAELEANLAALPFTRGKPSLLICHTVKGKGLPFAEHNPKWHHKTKVTDEELADMVCCIEGRHA